ncbi:MAG: DUF2892 domain-containing protein [Deltaproteobacteria bacterium]|nr:DUF2892 domain-containing protein [Deltaproteobacteria bacterium]MBK8715887.1 DUF2892 domain-containing protein [Deltaproteobacteria bacterium]MBP7286619.1 DUF2892 domain-containing protein [Nannocystaceae bacterium]
MTIARSLYVKNVPPIERFVRVLAAAAATGVGLMWLSSPWSWLVAISAVSLLVTGLVGYCPMCAMVGRRIG